ncbi:HTH tetR-type domain-containing protein [Pseudomonas jessenii]|uniref:TetR/AcrR family transcriptional regulator n=1 Tax=Pseudomonas jessenii TaxID=77298 RepID=UPI0039E102D5
MESSKELLARLEKYLGTFDWNGLTTSKQVILEAFLRVATRDGIASVSMRTLAAAVGLKPPTIYSHFPGGRDEILSNALRWHYNHYAHGLFEDLKNLRAPEESWYALINFHVRQQLQRPENDIWDTLIATDRIAKLLPEGLREEIEDWEGFVDFMYFSIAQNLGAKQCSIEARALRKLFDSIGAWWKWDGSEASLETAVVYCVEVSKRILKL